MKSSIRPRRIFQCISTLLVASLFLWLGHVAQAMMPPESTPTTTITVNTTTDELNNDGDCSLREAVVAANTNVAVDACGAGNGADTILIPTGVYTLTIEGRGENNAATGDLDIREAVTISGDGLQETIVVGNLSSTGFFDHIFHIVSSATGQVTFRTLGIQRNSTEGILSDVGTTVRLEEVALELNAPGMRSLGTLEVISSTFGANFLFSFTGNGAGLETNGPTTIENTLFAGNLLITLDNNTLNGAGWAHLSGAPATINNSTFVSNGWIYGVAPDPGYGTGAAIYATAPVTATNITFGGHNSVPLQNIPELVAGPVRLRNTITNLSSEVPNGCSDEVVSLGFNMSTGTDCTMFTQEGDELGVPSAAMNLQPLADNGGPSFTIALGVGSVARDSGPSFDCPVTDQRGVLRPQDGDGDGTGQCDRGAFEAGDGDPEPTGTPTPTGTNTPTVSPTASQTPSPTATGTPTLSPTATNTPTVSPTASQTALPTATETPTPTPTGTIQPTYTPLPTYTPYPTPSGERSLYLPLIYGGEE